MSPARALLLILPVCGALFFHDLDASDLWPSHEARAAQNAQRMLDDQHFGLPRLYDGQTDLQKPPAYYWLVAGLGTCRGGQVDRLAVRLPAAIAGTLTVLMVWFFPVREGRPLAGLAAALILASSIHFTGLARTGRIDMPLTAAITAGLLLCRSARRAESLRTLAAGICLGLAILLKGPIGWILPAFVITGWIIAERRREQVRDLPLPRTVLAASLVAGLTAAPWFLWAHRETGGEFTRVFFGHHYADRALGGSPDLAVHPWWYYVPRFAFDFLPWTPLLIVLGLLHHRRGRADSQAGFGLIWVTAMVLLLSFARFKRADYLLPAYPGAAICLGCLLEQEYLRRSHRSRVWLKFGFLALISATVAGWQWFHARIEPGQQAVREQESFAQAIRQHCPRPRPVLLFRVESHLLAWHLGRPVHTLVEWGDLNAALCEPGEHWVVTRAEIAPEFREFLVTRRLEVVARSDEFSVARPLRPLVLLRTTDEPDSCHEPMPKD